MKKWVIFIATILSLSSSVARADGLEEVVETYNKGNYAQVLELLRPLASLGIADAQYRLGFIYHMGKGDFKMLSPDLNKVKWVVMNQTRTRDDSPKGSRFFQDLLFGHVGYQLNNHLSLWVGYAHT